MKRKKGFTLAELLIVIAIIGVLAAIAIPILTAAIQKAKDTSDKVYYRQVLTATQIMITLGDIKFDNGATTAGFELHTVPKSTYNSERQVFGYNMKGFKIYNPLKKMYDRNMEALSNALNENINLESAIYEKSVVWVVFNTKGEIYYAKCNSSYGKTSQKLIDLLGITREYNPL